jgi:DNA-binding MarR family transcriptional regulator
MSASARLVAGALAEVVETTVVALADAAAVSKSTVAKTLSLLEDSGAAKRTVRETDGIREADLWSATPALAPLLAAATQDVALKVSASAVPSVAEDAAGADALGPAHDVSGEAIEMTAHDLGAATDVCWPKAGWAESQMYESVAEARLPNAALEAGGGSSVTDDGPDRQYASSATGGGTPRLAPGGLADLVAAALAARPHIEYTPTMLSHLLNGRSSGAIANVLAKMHTAGTAVRTCEKPKRYRHRDGRDADAL